MRFTNSLRRLAMLLILLIPLPMVSAAQQPEPGSEPSETITDDIDTNLADSNEDNQTGTKSAPSTPGDGDFKPSEEISEDFPVPLPSDI